MIALPIPDKRSPVRYRDIVWRQRNLGELVAGLTKGKQRADYRAHLDPDLREGVVPRERGWRPTLGQHGIAQGHLRKQGVGAGDVFLFWGLFRAVDHDLRWVGRPEHHIWGFLQVERVVSVDGEARAAGAEWRWARKHPHWAFPPDPSNTLYVGAQRLSLPGRRGRGRPGYGTFEFTSSSRRLTVAGARSPLDWSLLYPKVAEWLAAVILERRPKGRRLDPLLGPRLAAESSRGSWVTERPLFALPACFPVARPVPFFRRSDYSAPKWSGYYGGSFGSLFRFPSLEPWTALPSSCAVSPDLRLDSLDEDVEHGRVLGVRWDEVVRQIRSRG